VIELLGSSDQARSRVLYGLQSSQEGIRNTKLPIPSSSGCGGGGGGVKAWPHKPFSRVPAPARLRRTTPGE